MHIKQVIIDGFKSYANRTVINGWDPEFNAITGLNGSGKSNILDAICFVLGIEKLAQVRAKNLQELVYKQGQSRVTKASVSIVFDNADVKTSPMGYEDCKEITVTRQVVIGGRNKYLINGHTAQLGRVQNLFHSVQLNVNNPHFLIMQGRITKVCNMKPPEVLSMIEEAAGQSNLLILCFIYIFLPLFLSFFSSSFSMSDLLLRKIFLMFFCVCVVFGGMWSFRYSYVRK